MRKLIYSIGVTLFLAFMAFHVTMSLTNPFFGVSVEALAQGSGSGSGTEGGGCEDCLPDELCVDGECVLIPSNCLTVSDIRKGKAKKTGKCYKDAPGVDPLCGYTNTCVPAAGPELCNPHGCKSVPGCYVVPSPPER